MTTFLTPKEAARRLRASERTLERHRAIGTGPDFVRLGRKILYRVSDIEGWADANTFRSTSALSMDDRP